MYIVAISDAIVLLLIYNTQKVHLNCKAQQMANRKYASNRLHSISHAIELNVSVHVIAIGRRIGLNVIKIHAQWAIYKCARKLK